MVKKAALVALCVVMCLCFFGSGFIFGGLASSKGEDLQDANKWVCLIKSFESGDCVAYRWSDKRLEDLDTRTKKETPKDKPKVNVQKITN